MSSVVDTFEKTLHCRCLVANVLQKVEFWMNEESLKAADVNQSCAFSLLPANKTLLTITSTVYCHSAILCHIP